MRISKSDDILREDVEGSAPGSNLVSSRILCDCKPSILVVDDTEFNTYALKTMLKAMYDLDSDGAANG